MPLCRLTVENFTAFKSLEMPVSPGINIIVGENGTGKTHLLKAAYSAASVADEPKSRFPQKLVEVFLPHEGRIGRLVRRGVGNAAGRVKVSWDDRYIETRFARAGRNPDKAEVHSKKWQTGELGKSVYVPVKEVLANAPGFRSIYETREIEFDATHDDILAHAYLPNLRGLRKAPHKQLMEKIEKIITGKVEVRGEKFFLRDKQGDLEFSLLAEGWRKLALIWRLIQNGVLWQQSVLFWDEPETNLNPKLTRTLVEILIELQRQGVQIFVVTHDYAVLRWFELLTKGEDKISFHALAWDETGEISLETKETFQDIESDAISETFGEIFDFSLSRATEDVKI